MVKKIKPVSRIVRTETRVIRRNGRFYIQKKRRIEFEDNWSPPLDISETNGKITLTVEVPGVSQEDITVMVHTNLVEVRGSRKEKLPDKKIRFFRMEREYGHFKRSIFLPGLVDPDKTRAVLENGILIITLTKI
jgi:HSP20 family protein